MDEEEFVNGYFKWVVSQAFATEQAQKMYLGLLKVLFNIPFTWTMASDENRAGDASVFRHYERAQLKGRRHKLNSEWLDWWENADPSVLEVMIGICERWHQFYEFPTQLYFSHLFRNLGLHVYIGEGLRVSQEREIRIIVGKWLNREFTKTGQGSPFPLHPT